MCSFIYFFTFKITKGKKSPLTIGRIPPNLIQSDHNSKDIDGKAHCVFLKARRGKKEISTKWRSRLSRSLWLHRCKRLSLMWMNVLCISDVVPPLYKYLAQMELCCWDGRSSQPVISQGRTQYDSDSISTVGKWSVPCSARRRALTVYDLAKHVHTTLYVFIIKLSIFFPLHAAYWISCSGIWENTLLRNVTQ